MITREYLHRTLNWSKRELIGLSPLNLEGMEIRATIVADLKMGFPLDAVEERVEALHKILEALQKERFVLNGRQLASQLLLSIPDYRDHLHLLETYPDIPESLRSFLISDFLSGENYG